MNKTLKGLESWRKIIFEAKTQHYNKEKMYLKTESDSKPTPN